MARILSGIQTTGSPHLGNYLGAVRWWVADQRPGETFYFLADLHALNEPGDAAERRQATLGMAALLLAAGIDPDTSTLFLQSQVSAHTELAWLLQCIAGFGELRRMTQFKDKASKTGEETARVGLFTYPTLMAADILLYDAHQVPVGDDQRQHLELTRRLAERFNARYGQVFVVPEATIPPPGRGARIMDLQAPDRKMSKSSDSQAGVIGLFDEPAVIERKVKRAITDADDSDDAVRYDPEAKPGVSSLLELLGTITGRPPEAVADEYHRYGPLKADTAAAIIELLSPIQNRHRQLTADPESVMKVLRAGAERAGQVAQATLARAYDAVGLIRGV